MKENEGERSSTTATLLVVATLPDHHPPIRITEDENCAARIRGGSFWRTNIVAGHGETRPIVTPVFVVFSGCAAHPVKKAAMRRQSARIALRRFESWR